MANWNTIEELCDRYLGGGRSVAALAQVKKAQTERPEVRDVVANMFRLMALSCCDPKDILPTQTWTIGTALSGFLPDKLDGSAPPFTWAHRHARVDAYLSANPWASAGPGTVLLEMGCGFPPQTVIDVANTYPDWQIIGADPYFDQYLLYDEHGNYACLDASGRIRHFQPASANLSMMYEGKPLMLRHFSKLFETLLPNLPKSTDEQMAVVEKAGARLIRYPMRQYEAANLKFVQAGIGAAFAPVDIIRCFNVFGWFDTQFRQTAEMWALQTLRAGGLFICGNDMARSTETRYTIYRRENERLIAKEFAFSLDNVRNFTVAAWFSMHENRSETWTRARLVGVLRADGEFRSVFDRRYDAMLAEKRLFVRDANGYLVPAPGQLPQTEWIDAYEEILLQLEREGFAEHAAQVLCKAGYTAWVNRVGHVAVDPALFDCRL